MKVMLDLVAMAWFGLLVAAVWLLIKKRRKIGIALLSLVLILSIWALCDIPSCLLRALERPYLTNVDHKTAADAVVVCGGGWFASAFSIVGITLNESADRLTTAIELAREHRAPELVLGGGGPNDPQKNNESEQTKALIERWHLVDIPVNVLETSVNTHGEAVHMAELAKARGWKTIVLVTSSWHMRRAAAVFRKTGLTVIPFACDFRGISDLENRKNPGFMERYIPFPRTSNMQNMNIWMQEVVGYLYYKSRGWI